MSQYTVTIHRHNAQLFVVVYSLPWPILVGGSPIFPFVVHQPASPSIWTAVQSLRRGLSTNPGITMWCVCGWSWRDDVCCVCGYYKERIVVMDVSWCWLCVSMIWGRVIYLLWVELGCDEWGVKYLFTDDNNNNNNNCLKSNIQCIEIRVQWTVHLGSSHMHVHAVTRVHAVTPKLVICVMYLTSIWRILLMTDGLNAVWSNDRAAHTDTNPKNLELAPPQSITATRLDQLVYSPNYYIQIFQTQNNCPQWEAILHPARSESWAFATTPREFFLTSTWCGGGVRMILLLPLVARCIETID